MRSEQQLLAELGIIDPTVQQAIIRGDTKLLVLDNSAHMDWDWLLPFHVLVSGGQGGRAQDYFVGFTGYPRAPAVAIVREAAHRLNTDRAYRYSLCETAFIRAVAGADPTAFAALKQAATTGNLFISGGGITSPDNVLTHGEAFIRNYLVGHRWLAANMPGLPPITNAWLPDDFGQAESNQRFGHLDGTVHMLLP